MSGLKGEDSEEWIERKKKKERTVGIGAGRGRKGVHRSRAHGGQMAQHGSVRSRRVLPSRRLWPESLSWGQGEGGCHSGYRQPASSAVTSVDSPLYAWHCAGHRAPLLCPKKGDQSNEKQSPAVHLQSWRKRICPASLPGALASQRTLHSRDIPGSHEALSVLTCLGLTPQEALRGGV